ncbi:hypothetical protein GPECTOR_1g618 [Gonium pectorale]|uniref:Uncharacterized protein n=1 Tax=Gonium pectorale TaxID=33097 RepID=A0A150H3E1_GONPE|nr:hypothetical protein GPECTOR_1g618 [Gonium pectorale]|eukprot:KXZ56686.1 hypothetical protein GPECTOR_1g618 [Gonium pectorale]
MGPEKRKRKSVGAQPAEPAKERRLEDNYPTCKLVTVESPALTLSTGGRFSLAVTITAEAPVTQVPLAASPVVEVSLQSRPAQALTPLPTTDSQQQQQAAGGAGGAGSSASAPAGGPPARTSSSGPTFTLHRPGEPRAPPSMLLSPEWNQAIDEVCRTAASGAPLVLAVLGAKGVGKSSLARLAANRLLDEAPRLAFLDTDVGQPEFTPPGLMSLHIMEPGRPAVGPPHAHSRQPAAARFVGDVSPQHDPQLYLASAQALYGAYWEWAQRVVAGGGPWPPLLVNTHGWVKGLGFELLTGLLRLLAPTVVVQVRGGSEGKNLPRGAFWVDPRDGQAAAPAALITLESLADAAAAQQQAAEGGGGATPCAGGASSVDASGPGRPRGGPSAGGGGSGGGGGGGGAGSGATSACPRFLKPVESRALAWHAWAKRAVGCEPAWGSYQSDDLWRVAGLLASAAPFRASLDSLHVQLLGGSLPPHQVGRLLNGAVVGLVATQRPAMPQALPPPAAATARPSGGSAAAATASATAAAAAATDAALWGLDEAAAAAAYPPGRVSYAGATYAPPPLLPCVGLGIVRCVDMARREVFLLTDCEPELLQCVGVLVVGRLELPGSLVVGGEVAWPYQQLFGLSAEATGAGAGRARKNLSRASLVGLAG